jgi:hypothetical protein
LSEISCWEIITLRRLFYWSDHTDPSMFDLIHIISHIRINQSFIKKLYPEEYEGEVNLQSLKNLKEDMIFCFRFDLWNEKWR